MLFDSLSKMNGSDENKLQYENVWYTDKLFPIATTYMKPDELQKAPKIFCENIKLGFTPEYFVIGLSSGEQASIYSLTPEHAKRLLQYLGHELEHYEKTHGEIKAEWSPHVVSPVQVLNSPTDKS